MQDVLAGQARWAVVCADARSMLASMPDASVDAVVTDPPYALTNTQGGSKGFMGATWDTGQVAHDPAFWAEVLRVAKPGAFLLAFGGTRTYHRLACAIEDAGWECRDMIMWHYGSGFPKSKSCLKPAHEPILLAKAPGPLQPLQIDAARVRLQGDEDLAAVNRGNIYGAHGIYGACANKTPPAMYKAEGRWPPNVLFSHVGGPDGCQPAGVRRVRDGGRERRASGAKGRGGVYGASRVYDSGKGTATPDGYETAPAWACHPQCPIRLLDEQAGPRTSKWGKQGASRPGSMFLGAHDATDSERFIGDTGNASRFFPTFAPDPEDAVPFRYCSKASRAERDRGCDALPRVRGGAEQYDSRWKEGVGDLRQPMTRNGHPTVKPTSLMAWLCKLVTPEDGLVLDCFGGSGSTAVAAVRCGMRAIVIEQDPHYASIAKARISHAYEQAIASASQPEQHHLPLIPVDCDRSGTE